MSRQAELVDWVTEAMEAIGTIRSRRMMGGHTLYCDGTVFCIIAFDQLWLKSDAASDAEWDEAGCARFTYDRQGKTATMNYRAAPEDAYDDLDVLRHWAARGLAAGRRAAVKTPRKKKDTG